MAERLLKYIPHAVLDADTRVFSNLRIGGTCAAYIEVSTVEELQLVMTVTQDFKLPMTMIGGGTNTVFPPRYEGVVVKIAANDFLFGHYRLTAKAGATWMPILRQAQAQFFSGLEAFTGLPGTVGGAVRGNAGCFGIEVKDVLLEATIVDANGAIHTHPKEWFEFAYRDSRLKREGGVVWEAVFSLDPDTNPLEIQKKMKEVAALRASKQPAGRSTGSFFKNPTFEARAGILIDQAGLKGVQIGGVQVSPKHGNFLMNVGDGQPEELADLIALIQAKVEDLHGFRLEPEVVFVDPEWWNGAIERAKENL